MPNREEMIVENLSAVLAELKSQQDVGDQFPPDQKNFRDTMEDLREWVEDVNEYGLAYEVLVCMLESHPFRISGSAAVKLLEVALLLGYKTTRDEDAMFDIRRRNPA